MWMPIKSLAEEYSSEWEENFCHDTTQSQEEKYDTEGWSLEYSVF